jgi:hypothetical protein
MVDQHKSNVALILSQTVEHNHTLVSINYMSFYATQLAWESDTLPQPQDDKNKA